MEENEKYQKAIAAVGGIVFLNSVIEDAGKKLGLIRQILARNILLSEFAEDTQEHVDAMQLLYAVDEIVTNINNYSEHTVNTAAEISEILGDEFPKSGEPIH